MDYTVSSKDFNPFILDAKQVATTNLTVNGKSVDGLDFVSGLRTGDNVDFLCSHCGCTTATKKAHKRLNSIKLKRSLRVGGEEIFPFHKECAKERRIEILKGLIEESRELMDGDDDVSIQMIRESMTPFGDYLVAKYRHQNSGVFALLESILQGWDPGRAGIIRFRKFLKMELSKEIGRQAAEDYWEEVNHR